MTLPRTTTRTVRIPGTETTTKIPARDVLSVVGLAIFVVIGYGAGGVTGGITAAVAALVALVVPVAVGFTLGQLALLAVVSIGDIYWLAAAQLALVILLTEPARDRNATATTVATLAAFVLLAVVAGLGLRRSIVAAAGGVGLVVAAGLYVMHRYERVRLGLVDDAPDAKSTSNTTEPDDTMTSTTEE